MSGDDRDDTTATLIDADPSDSPSGTEETLSDADARSAAELLPAMRDERDRLKDQLLRTAADFDNFRKRTRKDLDEAERRGREDTVREMLPVFDNLERAVQAAAGAKDVASIVDGLKMVLKLFEDQVQRIGIERVVSVGQRFDPAIHDAIQQQETDEHPPGTVIAEVVPGYRLGERLVRPAMVVVARKPSVSA
ncbi:MAG: nucleotide exchange factor GrpE [Myxococcota bacterium]|nr:nucleotide exchange factor GrpE [Myxococcota bacterium]